MNDLIWEKVKNKFGDYDYVSGRFKIEPTGQTEYRWYLYGGKPNGIGTSGECRTLGEAKRRAQRIRDGLQE